ncbi:hypothetical protein Pcinc_008921 [Petrolisthes cinctipes]|uniref:RRM domain-containing protein n=1 Tax=Petrolisthes cinctipes TaxID=88211 RepID=A0AAE1G6F3_PETCI|nr:hypothetical protein Pcinc_008921 [Petrolisthes cinctipes]
MPNGLNDLSDLYGSLNLGECEADDGNLESFIRINSFLNNSLDLRTLASDTTHRNSIDSMLSGLMAGCEGVAQTSVAKKTAQVGSVGSSGVDASLPLSRLLAHSYSYSSDSSHSPHTPLTPRTAPQVCSRNSVFSYMDDSPQSSGSSSSRLYSQSPGSGTPGLRTSTNCDPGSPTMEDAILMGCHEPSTFNNQDLSTNKLTDATIANLLSTLNLGSSGNSGTSCSSVFSPSLDVLTRSNSVMSSPSLGNAYPQQQLPNAALLGLHHQQQQQQQTPLQLPSLNTFHTGLGSSSHDIPTLAQLQTWSSMMGGDAKAQGCLSNLVGSPPDPYSIEKAAKLHRNAAAMCDATCTWSGQLPNKLHKNPVYSCKVFLGGVPWDVTETTLKQTFLSFGNIQVEWPGKESSANPPRGYVYILFEHEKQVQIIPWVIGDSNYVRCPSYQLDPAKTVFVGALHGMLSAEGLANIMNDLFGGVVYSGIDTDKHKYPIGSGRVTFNNVQSYRKAVRAAFIEIKTPKFTKKVQVDPYLADSLCQLCGMQQGPYFCRDENCFKYFCRPCWQLTHPTDAHGGHKPIMRNSKLRSQTTLTRVI